MFLDEFRWHTWQNGWTWHESSGAKLASKSWTGIKGTIHHELLDDWIMCWNAPNFPMIIAHCEKGCECGEALRHFLNLIDESVSAFSSQIRTCGPLCFPGSRQPNQAVHGWSVLILFFSDRVSSDVSVGFQAPHKIHSLQVDAHDYGDRPQNLGGHPAMRLPGCRDVVLTKTRWLPWSKDGCHTGPYPCCGFFFVIKPFSSTYHVLTIAHMVNSNLGHVLSPCETVLGGEPWWWSSTSVSMRVIRSQHRKELSNIPNWCAIAGKPEIAHLQAML